MSKCKGKIKYYGKGEAWIGALNFYLKFQNDQSPYKCPECDFYHLTSKKGNVPDFIKNFLKALKDDETH